jgi:FixJ family two-component response regulator
LTKIAESNAAKAIVVRLGIGVKTVESHRSQPCESSISGTNESGRSAASGNS